MDDQERSNQALLDQFRQERARMEAHPPRKRRRYLHRLTMPWILAIAVFVLVVGFLGGFVLLSVGSGAAETVSSFCQAEGQGRYDTAYNMLSARVQARVSLQTFTQESTTNFVSCDALPGPGGGLEAIKLGFSVLSGANRMHVATSYQTAAGSSARTDGSMTIVLESGIWHIDAMTPDILHLSS